MISFNQRMFTWSTFETRDKSDMKFKKKKSFIKMSSSSCNCALVFRHSFTSLINIHSLSIFYTIYIPTRSTIFNNPININDQYNLTFFHIMFMIQRFYCKTSIELIVSSPQYLLLHV